MINNLYKKAVMFGLDCRALKKQFGKLFLASRQSEAPIGANDSCGYYKHGAMFGLDARIALVIFGTLSVISGAMLYSAIKDAKVTAVIAQAEEYSKAYYAYYLDTGNELPNNSGNLYDVEVNALISSSVEGWEGPYIPNFPAHATDTWKLVAPGYQHMYFVRATSATWNDATGLEAASCDKVANKGKCEVWLVLGPVSADIVKEIDIKLDASVTQDTGKVRVIGTDMYYNIGESDVGN